MGFRALELCSPVLCYTVWSRKRCLVAGEVKGWEPFQGTFRLGRLRKVAATSSAKVPVWATRPSYIFPDSLGSTEPWFLETEGLVAFSHATPVLLQGL